MGQNSENTQEILEQNAEESEVAENLGLDTNVSDNQDTQEEKDWKAEFDRIASEKEALEKTHKEYQSFADKRTKELGDLRKFKKEYEPYLGYLQSIADQEKQQKYQQDPQLQLREYVESQLAPFREQQLEVQTTKTVQTLQSELGDEAFDTLAPIMANVLAYYAENNPQVAEFLTQNPIALVRQAAGDLYLHNQQQSKQQNTQLQATKKTASKTMGGIAKTTLGSARTTSDVSKMSASEMLQHLKRTGIAKEQ